MSWGFCVGWWSQSVSVPRWPGNFCSQVLGQGLLEVLTTALVARPVFPASAGESLLSEATGRVLVGRCCPSCLSGCFYPDSHLGRQWSRRRELHKGNSPQVPWSCPQTDTGSHTHTHTHTHYIKTWFCNFYLNLWVKSWLHIYQWPWVLALGEGQVRRNVEQEDGVLSSLGRDAWWKQPFHMFHE